MQTTRTPTSLGLLGNAVDDIAAAAAAAKGLRDNLYKGGVVIALSAPLLEETLENLLSQIQQECAEALKTLRERKTMEARDAGAR